QVGGRKCAADLQLFFLVPDAPPLRVRLRAEGGLYAFMDAMCDAADTKSEGKEGDRMSAPRLLARGALEICEQGRHRGIAVFGIGLEPAQDDSAQRRWDAAIELPRAEVALRDRAEQAHPIVPAKGSDA